MFAWSSIGGSLTERLATYIVKDGQSVNRILHLMLLLLFGAEMLALRRLETHRDHFGARQHILTNCLRI